MLAPEDVPRGVPWPDGNRDEVRLGLLQDTRTAQQALRPTPYTLLYTVVADIAAIDIDWD